MILLVEDNIPMRSVLRLVLESLNVNYLYSSTVSNAQGILKGLKVDVLMVGLTLENEKEITPTVKLFRERNKDGKLILYASPCCLHSDKDSFTIKPDYLLLKPFKLEDLETAIRQCSRPLF